MIPFDPSLFKKNQNSFPDYDWVAFVVKSKEVKDINDQYCQEQIAFDAVRKGEIPKDSLENHKYFAAIDQSADKLERLHLRSCTLQNDLHSLAGKLKSQIEGSKNKPIQIVYAGVTYEFFITSDVIPVNFKKV